MVPLDDDVDQPIEGYEILEQIGSGATSSVYRARQLSLDREVALKVVRGDRAERETKLRRMEKEAQLLARLDHPYIVRSIDFGETGELVYFVMEYVKGRSGKQFLESRGRLPVRDSIVFTERVAQALHAAAAHGVIHRDVKPGNILLGTDGSVKLSDFGLARVSFDRSLTRDGTTLGTPQYMSPEQVKHARGVDLRSDLYSLGATLYHLVTGQAPFHGESVAEILHEVLYGRPTPPEQLVEDIPPALSRVIARLMARDPARRYQDVPSLLRDLQRVRRLLDPDAAADPDPIGLSWQAAAESPRVWTSRWPIVGGAAALVLLGFSLALLFDGGGREPVLDPEPEEVVLLQRLRADLEPSSALRTLHLLDESADRGVFAGTVELLVETTAAATEQATEFLRGCGRAAAAAAEQSLQRGELEGAEDNLNATYARRLEVVGEVWKRPADELCGFDVTERSETLLSEANLRLETIREAVRSALLNDHLDRGGALRQAYGSVSDGLLADYRFLEVDRRRAEFEAGLSRAREAAVRGALERHEVRLAAEVQDLVAKLPESMRLDFQEQTRRLLEDLDEKRAARFLELEAEVQLSINRARGEVERLRWEDPRAGRSTAEWMQRLEASFPVAGIAALDADPGNEWRSALTDFERILNETLDALRATRATEVLESILHGDAASEGVLVSLEERRPDRALLALEKIAESDRAAEHQEWTQVAHSLDALLEDTWSSLERRAGTTVSLWTTQGIQVKGPLDFRGRELPFKVARKELTIRELPLSLLLEESSVPPTPLVLSLARLLWGGKEDREELDGSLADLPVASSVAGYVRERFEQEKMVAEGRQQELEDEASRLWVSIGRLVEQERFLDAQESLARLETLRYRKTRTVLDRHAEFDDLKQIIALGQHQQDTVRSLSSLYEHAAVFEVELDATAHLLYDFQSVAQGEDFLLSRGVRVANGRMEFLHTEGTVATKSGFSGPSLPLSIDRSRPFRITMVIIVLHDEGEPPHFFGIEADGLCAGFFQPTHPRRAKVAPQANAWSGRLFDYAEFFFDPLLEQQNEPSRGGLPARVGLDVRRHVVKLDWDPGRELPLELHLDRALVIARNAPLRESGRGLLEVRVRAPKSTLDRVDGSERLRIESIEFRGALVP